MDNRIVGKGLLWTGLDQFGTQFLNLAFMLLLMRLMSPSEFGLIAMVTTITGFAGILVNFGFGQALIQKKDITENHLSSVFWLNVIIGIFLITIIIFFAGAIANFYEEPVLKNLTYFISSVYFFSTIRIVPQILLTKHLKFKSLSIINLFATLASGAIAVFFAFKNYGVWSLAIQKLALFVFTSVLFFMTVKWRPKFIFDVNAIKDLWKFSSNLFANHSINYWVSNVDKILIGKYLGGTELGLFSRSFAIIQIPVAGVCQSLYKVFFPILSKVQNDIPQIQQIYLRVLRMTAIVVLPALLFISIYSEQIIKIVFTQEWYGMISLISILAIVALLNVYNDINVIIFYPLGRTDTILKINMISKFILLICVVVGLRWGINGVAIGLLISWSFNYLISLFACLKLLNMTHFEYLVNLKEILFISLFVSTLFFMVDRFLFSNVIQSPFWEILLAFCLYSSLFALIAKVVGVQAYSEWNVVIRKMMKSIAPSVS